MPVDDSFLDALRRPQPDPGGGSAAAHGALTAVCLLQKVAVLEKNRASEGSHHKRWWSAVLDQILALAEDFRRLRGEDAEAYRRLAEAIKTEKASKDQDEAAVDASRVPLTIMETSARALKTAHAVGERCARRLWADVAVAAEFLGSAVQGAFWIGLANAERIKDMHRREDLVQILCAQRAAGEDQLHLLRKALKGHIEAGR